MDFSTLNIFLFKSDFQSMAFRLKIEIYIASRPSSSISKKCCKITQNEGESMKIMWKEINQVKRCLQEMSRVFYAERRVPRAKRRFMVIDGNCPPPGQMITISQSILVIFKGLMTIYATSQNDQYFQKYFGDFQRIDDNLCHRAK